MLMPITLGDWQDSWGGGLESIVKLAFVTGFLSDMSTALQQLLGIENMEMSVLLVSSRSLIVCVNRARNLDPLATTKFRSQCFWCKG